MITFWRQFKLLLWKCVLVKWRQKFWLSTELIVPCLLFIVIALVRTRDFNVSEEQCHFDSKALPSAGLLPFIHSFFCSFANECHFEPTNDDEMRELRNYGNESLIVDLLYYSSMQFKWIGENPTKFDALVELTAKLIHKLAQMNDSFFRLEQLLDNPNKFKILLDSLGIKKQTINKLLSAEIKPDAMKMQNLFDCDLNRILEFGNVPMTKSEIESVCEQRISIGMYLIKHSVVPREPNAQMTTLFEYLNDLYDGLEPIRSLIQKYPNMTVQNLTDAVFCGNDPKDIIEYSVNPNHDATVETPFEKLRKTVIEFIKTVTPGHHPSNSSHSCAPVPPIIDLGCSQLEGSLVGRMRPILQGFILVTPDTALTRTIIDRLNEPLRQLAYVRELIYEFVGDYGERLAAGLYGSDLYAASQTVLAWLRRSPQTKLVREMEYVLEHMFEDASQPLSFTAAAIKYLGIFNKYSSCLLIDRFRFVANETELENNALCLMDESQFFTGIVFNITNSTNNLPDLVSYKIRHLPEFVDSTFGLMDSKSHPFSRHKPLRDLKYLTYGFTYLQESIDRAIIDLKSNQSITEDPMGFFVQQEPFPCTTKDTFNVALFMPLFLVISFIFPSALLVKNIVHEKELRIKEQMRSMGLGDSVHYLSWALISLIINLFSVLVISIICKLANIFRDTDYTLLLVCLLIFMLSSIAMSIFLSTLFTNANIATAATCVAWFLFFTPFQLKSDSIKTPTVNRISLLLPPTAMGYTFKLIESFNAVERATWQSLPEMTNEVLGVSVIRCLLMLILDMILFLVLAWYISAVSPGDYGVALPLYFPFLPSYWRRKPDEHSETYIDEESENEEDEPATVLIRNMSKVYENGTKALDGLSLNLYENQITGLLGHNGAGKTTTMSILSGLYEPSHGTAVIYGKDIRTELAQVRRVLGICPQHNVLFTHLTVAEQLRLFAALKGLPAGEVEENVLDVLQSVSLTDKAHQLASTLSGGMKRRLSIAIAFIGGSKFVILDEPTAGVDVNARKEIWKLLQENKQGRTILMSTHHMDEADVLSDRVAIMSNGRLLTCGTSVYLKNTYGEHMSLVVCRNPGESTIVQTVCELGSEIGVQPVDEQSDEEIMFRLPIDTDSKKLEDFFWKLDAAIGRRYGISAPSLQNIFVSLAPHVDYKVPRVDSIWTRFFKSIRRRFTSPAETDEQELVNEEPDDDVLTINELPTPNIISSPWRRLAQHFMALISCRLSYTRARKMTLLYQAILPILLLIACEAYVKMQVTRIDLQVNQDPLPLDTILFGNRSDFYASTWDRNRTTARLIEAMFNSPGPGARCAYEDDCIESEGTFELDYEAKNYNANASCGCEEFGWNCTMEHWEWAETPWARLNSTNRVWNLNNRNVTQFRMITRNQQIANSTAPFFLGGFTFGHYNPTEFDKTDVQSMQQGWRRFISDISAAGNFLNVTIPKRNDTPIIDPFTANITSTILLDSIVAHLNRRLNTKLWFNNKIWPAVALATNIASNAQLRAVNDKSMADVLGILTINHPMNETIDETLSLDFNNFAKSLALFRVTCLLLVMAMLPAGFTVFLVEDRICESYHLQLVSGLHKITYWLTSFIYDYVFYTVATILIICLYLAFQVKEFVGSSEAALVFWLVLAIYGIAAILYAYAIQSRFSVPAMAFVFTSLGSYFLGVLCTLTVIMVENLMLQDETLIPTHQVCSIVFLLIPEYNLGMTIYRSSMVFQIRQIGANFLESINRPDAIKDLPLPPLLQWNVIGIHACALAAHCFVSMLCLILTQSEIWSRRGECIITRQLMTQHSSELEDDDVRSERNRVNSMSRQTESSAIIVRDVAKTYDKEVLAVRGVSFAVEGGECFGLLGVNGAGKTTTFAMLTGKVWPGHGTIEMAGTCIRADGQTHKDFTQIGYCPQFDALNMNLTTIENLRFFARLRGIEPSQIPSITSHLLKALHLKAYAKTPTSQLSGGNRRKLSVAIALIAQPSVVLLDEPSAGMDPGSQRFMWRVIDALRLSGKAVVLTSHSMEECEALCTRIAIMADGRIRCLGGKQHLKIKYGDGLSLLLKMSTAEDARNIAEKIVDEIAGRLESIHCTTVFMRISATVPIAMVLSVVNKLKASFNIEDFTLSQATLDNVFQAIAESKDHLQNDATTRL